MGRFGLFFVWQFLDAVVTCVHQGIGGGAMVNGLLGLLLVTLQGIPWEGPNVSYGPDDVSRQTAYDGSRIEYLDAIPGPGAVLTSGSTVEFRVRVRYTLQQADVGRLLVWFTGRNGELLDLKSVGARIPHAVAAEQAVSIAATVPQGLPDLVLHVGVAPGERQRAVRTLRIRYSVAQAR